MKTSVVLPLVLASITALSGCQKPFGPDVERADTSVNVIDENNLNEVMLSTADPEESVAYFQRSLQKEPNRIAFLRGLAAAQLKAGDPNGGAATWKKVANHSEATKEDKVNYADALIRTGEWNDAKAVLDTIPPTYETFKRYRLEAMIADSREEWSKSDSFYEIAVGLTTTPAGVLNNWGYSKLTRGDYAGAEKLFSQAITYDPGMFTAKNNLVLARSAQGKYDLPVVQMTQTERAELLYTTGLAAVKSGDVTMGKGLIKEAIDTHPQHFEAAVRSLRALEANVNNG